MKTGYLFVQQNFQWVLLAEMVEGCEYTLGRSRSSDIKIDDEHCGRLQLKFALADEGWCVQDLKSTNPTLVDKQLLANERRLESGNVISVGSGTLLLFSTDKSLTKGSISSLIERVRFGTGEARTNAQHDLVNNYFQRLCGLARKRSVDLDCRMEGPEDAALSALASFFGAIDGGRLESLSDRNDLWRILATFTARKVIRQRERQFAVKRAANRTVTGSALTAPNAKYDTDVNGIDLLPDRYLDHVLMIELQESFELFLDQLEERQRELARMKTLEGATNQEIADRLGCSERTIERHVGEIRKMWVQFDSDS